MSEHKRCPYCGGDPEMHSYISTKNFIICSICRNGTAMHEKASEAWAAWDRRGDAAIKELVEAAKAMLVIFEESDSECSACRHAYAECDGNREICLVEAAIKNAIKEVEGL